MRRVTALALGLSLLTAGCKNTEFDCKHRVEELPTVPIEEHILTRGTVSVSERDSNAGIGSALGGVAAAGLAHQTGAMNTGIAGLAGAAIGGLAGHDSGTTTTTVGGKVIHCQFRIQLDGLPLIYYGEEESFDDDAFQKCTMFHVGDLVTPIVGRRVCTIEKTSTVQGYAWKSGLTVGRLQ